MKKEPKYIWNTIPWASIARFLLVVVMSLAVWRFIGYVIPSAWKLYELGNFTNEVLTSMHQLGICSYLAIAVGLIDLTAICFCAWIKRGFNNLKPKNKGGIYSGLTINLYFGIGVLAIGLFLGMAIGTIEHMLAFTKIITFTIGGLIIGATIGLIFGLLGTLGGTLAEIFSNEKEEGPPDEEPEATDDTEPSAETTPAETDDTETTDENKSETAAEKNDDTDDKQ